MKNLNLDFGDDDLEKARSLIRRMGEFIALYEEAQEKLEQREEQLQAYFQAQGDQINETLQQIYVLLQEFQTFMTEIGVARWRVAAENSLQASQDQLKALNKTLNDFRHLTQETCEKLERSTDYTVRSVSEAVNHFNITDFRLLTEDSCKHVEAAALDAVKHVAKITRWAYWRKTILVFGIAIVSIVITGLYINDEWPWEEHHDASRERNAGKAVIQVWPDLTQADRDKILKYSKKAEI